MNTQTEINNAAAIEMEKRIALASNPEFIATCIEHAKKAGITPKQWNENKVSLLMMFANQALSTAQNDGLDTFGVTNDKLLIPAA